MGLFNPSYINVEIGKYKIPNAATKVGTVVDICTGGKYHAREIGQTIDKVTEKVTVKIPTSRF